MTYLICTAVKCQWKYWKLTVFPRPVSWRSLIRRGVTGRGKEWMRKGKGGEGQKGMKRNGREGDEKKEKLCPCSLQKSTDTLNAI